MPPVLQENAVAAVLGEDAVAPFRLSSRRSASWARARSAPSSSAARCRLCSTRHLQAAEQGVEAREGKPA